MRKIICGIIRLYQYVISPCLTPRCRFFPSCSQYAILAIENYGIVRGIYLACHRILRCHPWAKGGHDPI